MRATGALPPGRPLRPRHYLLDVELLLMGEYVAPHADRLALTPLGAACLDGSSGRRAAAPSLG